ncbi:MAG TPA: TAT-variant-translocated molybdopterin oxidoreductase [Flavobacteriales bacterium]|nr:TAT-variant-translocated molybdopterin oxidoreductase [Flavobacteriales bacterium]
MSNSKKYWKGIEELQATPEFVKLQQNEFAEDLPVDQFLGDERIVDSSTNRRDFLKFLGFSVTAASLAACETPVRKAIPYLNKPEEITPGVANYYASTYWDGNDYAGVLVKTREGRPIKVDGNELCSITKGGSHARVQASVLSLYDSARIKGAMLNNKDSDWKAVDAEVTSKLASIAAAGGAIRILTSSLISPSMKSAIAEFTTKYPTTQVVTYDSISYKGIADSNLASFGKSFIPTYNFDKADFIVGIGCDFLANWLSPVEHARQYAETRKLNKDEKKMSRHVQIESLLTVTGSNADKRIALKPSQLGLAVVNLYNKLTGSSLPSKSLDAKDAAIAELAKELNASKGKALVVCGSNDANIQQVVNAINTHLGSYGSTINKDVEDYTRQGNDAAVNALVAEMASGKVGAILINNVNPVYSLPNGAAFKDALSKVSLSVSFADRVDETAAACKIVAPDHHYLESWTDANPRKGHYALGQPTINPLFSTRQVLESILTWAGNTTNAHDYISKVWETTVYPSSTGFLSFNDFWFRSLHDGVMASAAPAAVIAENPTPEAPVSIKIMPITIASPEPTTTVYGDVSNAASAIVAKAGKASGIELVVYQKTGAGTGNQANNPWLQELPDPITKVTWDNYVLMNPEEMKEKGFNTLMGQEQMADVVEVKSGSATASLPVVAQPGLPKGVIAIALGYGRTAVGKTANGIGANASPFVSFDDGTFNYIASGVSVSESKDKYQIAATQTHHTMMGREIVKEATLAEYKKDSKAGNEDLLYATNLTTTKQEGKATAKELDLWAAYENKNHFWNMAIDLNACIGCGSCVISCTAENNVPVVGKDEVRRSREMHWMRIDRYYSSDMNEEVAEKDGVGAIDKFLKMEVPSSADTIEVVFQPIMCQHCNHAPCETVCPVLATTHSLEGLNQMTYNRCIGTRYCANNCPYKVRRFNWFRYNENVEFDFNMYDDLGKMVLNPDVTVRSRGVMEKCSMCIQRIQAGKLDAKKNSSRPKDGSIKTACQQACPTNAITFGDFNDQQSEVRKAWNNERKYQLLEEVGTQPSVFYLTKIRNKSANEA